MRSHPLLPPFWQDTALAFATENNYLLFAVEKALSLLAAAVVETFQEVSVWGRGTWRATPADLNPNSLNLNHPNPLRPSPAYPYPPYHLPPAKQAQHYIISLCPLEWCWTWGDRQALV